MEFSRRTALAAATLAASAPATTPARAQTPPIRLGVLTDMSGPYAGNRYPGVIVGEGAGDFPVFGREIRHLELVW